MKTANRVFCGLALGMMVAGPTLAAVGAEEAKQLGGPVLTEFGAEKAGNKEGTIPAYDGKVIKSPAGWDRKTQGYPDPWGEKPLFTITAQNAAQYADKLDAFATVFKKFPEFRMDVYPSHRTATYPRYVLDNTIKNATACKGAQDELKLEGCYGGLPFPIPKTGRQAMWNHLLSFTASNLRSEHLGVYITTPGGKSVLQTALTNEVQYPMYLPENAGKVFPSNTSYFMSRADFVGPARQVGTKVVLIYSLDTLNQGSRAWQYIPGQRRVKLAPDLAYDTPSPASGGAATMDDQAGFLGAMDRFDFKLVGKKEKFLPYNNFALTDPKVCPDEKFTSNPHVPDPACVRWELHRVWKVEATLKPEFRHIYRKRIFFWDEDTYGAGATESYDAAGNIYRMGFSQSYPIFDAGGTVSLSWAIMDLQTGAWTSQGGMGSVDGSWGPTKPQSAFFYSPEALAGEGIR